MIKSYRRKGWPKGKASSALPLIALGLGLYAVSRTGRVRAKAPSSPAPVPSTPEPEGPSSPSSPADGPSSPADGPTEAERAWGKGLVQSLNNSGAEFGTARQNDMIRMLQEVNQRPGSAAQGLANVRAAMEAGLPPSVQTFCDTMAGTIPGVVPLISAAEIAADFPITHQFITEMCGGPVAV